MLNVVDARQGYTYSVFNLVYETNTASTKIWDSLGFKRIGRVPGCGNLKSFPEPVDAIIYGRDLKAEEGQVGNEERFDKIRYYLRHSLYPQGADRSEKSRLRSAATHYKLIPAHEGVTEKLMLKDKEVISDPQAQYDIAKAIHLQAHGGINKTTAVIATKYHWVRIKETVSHVIKNCPECKDTNKPPILRGDGTRAARSKTLEGQERPQELPPLPPTPVKQEAAESERSSTNTRDNSPTPMPEHNGQNGHDLEHETPLSSHDIPDISHELQQSLQQAHMPMNVVHQDMNDDDFKSDHLDDNFTEHISPEDYRAIQQQMGLIPDGDLSHNMQSADSDMTSYDDMAIDPQIMQQFQAQMAAQEFEQQEQVFSMPPPAHHNMQHFVDNQRPSLQQQHPDIHSDPGPHHPQFDPGHMPQSHHDPRVYSQQQSPTDFSQSLSQPSSQYISPVQQPHMMSQPVPDDHIMSGQLDESGGGMESMHQIRHVLPMEYMTTVQNPNDPNHFQQQRQ